MGYCNPNPLVPCVLCLCRCASLANHPRAFLLWNSLQSLNLLLESKYRKYMQPLIKRSFGTNHNPLENLRAVGKLKVCVSPGRNTCLSSLLCLLFHTRLRFHTALYLFACVLDRSSLTVSSTAAMEGQHLSLSPKDSVTYLFLYVVPKEADCSKTRQSHFKSTKTDCVQWFSSVNLNPE